MTTTKDISAERKEQLKNLSIIINESIKELGFAKINFICTHNSRRSQLAELLLHDLGRRKGLKQLHTYSGGTEATAFNYRMVDALRKSGYDIEMIGKETSNPLYTYNNYGEDHYFFSKKYDHSYNPGKDFIAVTVCSDADENCPLIHNCRERFHLGYEDPKKADDTDLENQAYSEKVQEIKSEMSYLLSLIL